MAYLTQLQGLSLSPSSIIWRKAAWDENISLLTMFCTLSEFINTVFLEE